MSQARDRSNTPRAIIHKLILDAAEASPEASMAELAEEVTGASIDMVEKVLTKYGDPGEATAGPPAVDEPVADDSEADRPAESDSVPMAQTESETDDTSVPNDGPDVEAGSDAEADVEAQTADPHAPDSDDPASSVEIEDPPEAASSDRELDLTENQLKTLRLISERPDASQAELSEDLDVTSATVSRWVNEIPDFDWGRREEIANALLTGTMDASSAPTDQHDLESLRVRIDAIERQIDTASAPALPLSPEVAQKVLHACLHSDRITEDEELELLAAFMGHGDTA